MKPASFKRRFWWLTAALTALLCLLVVQPALADGIIIPNPPPEIPITEVQNLAIRYHKVTVTINGPIATTHVDQVFVNESRYAVEGTYVFPLPADAAVSAFAMTVDGKRMDGELLSREEARRIYEEIVRRRRDPALLEYVGRGAFRASIFPIPPRGERRIEIEYSQVLTAEAGLTRYSYALGTERFSSKPIDQVSIAIDIRTDSPLRAIYSPSHDVAVTRDGSFRARVGYEESKTRPDRDFELYFSTSAEPFGVNVLSYQPAGEDGFFLLLASPEMVAERQQVVARDIVLVLDTSGSMQGDKIRQAKRAATFILDHLNEADRFNIVDFSTGVRSYAERMAPASQRRGARAYVDDLVARGGTDINRALAQALTYTRDSSRPQVIIFLTDGLATEGVVETDKIIANVDAAAGGKVRIFTFGVGYDVNTMLLDTVAQSHRGASAYIAPAENIESKVSEFYAKISAPVLSNPELDFGNVRVSDVYPYPLPDFFLGSQLVLVGRYRRGADTTITLTGDVNGQPQRFTYKEVRFTSSGGDPFVSRLWATRKVGYLLNQIRLHGENRELVDELVHLSIRYGIITPYTSFLVQEDQALTSAGRQQIVDRELKAASAPAPASGEGAVKKSVASQDLGAAQAPATPQSEEVRSIGDRTFVKKGGVWTDTLYEADRMTAVRVQFGSPAYFDLLTRYPASGQYLALGDQVVVVLDGKAYQVGSEGASAPADPPAPRATPAVSTPTPWYGVLGHWWRDLFHR